MGLRRNRIAAGRRKDPYDEAYHQDLLIFSWRHSRPAATVIGLANAPTSQG